MMDNEGELDATSPEAQNGLKAPLSGLRVGVDARVGPAAGLTGVATYRAGLTEALQAAGAEVVRVSDGAWPPLGFARLGIRSAALGARDLHGAPSETTDAIGRRDVFREAQLHFTVYGRLLRLTTPEPPDVMHWSYPLPLRLEGARNLYTIHDAIPLRRPDLTTISARRHRRLLDAIRQSADGMLTVSECSRRDLQESLRDWRGGIVNTYQSLPRPPCEDVSLSAGLSPQAYLLFCGGADPRKNLRRAVEAHRLSGVNAPLAVVGPGSHPDGNFDNAIRHLGWVTRGQLLSLISQARALIFPSLAEGFGLPVLEAMSLGTPVITSDRGALAEIAADAARLVDPLDIAAMASAIAEVWRDDALCAELARRGRSRAQTFAMAAHGARLAQAYRRAGV